MNPISQTKKIEQVRSQVMDLLRWDEQAYGLFFFERGLAYLFEYFNGDETLISFVSIRKEFWSWFKNEWYYRDLAFVETFDLTYVGHRQIELWYRELHNPCILAAEIFPGRTILGNEFATIHKLPEAC